MKNLFAPLAAAAALGSLLISIQPAPAQGTAFTYQGQLSASGGPASGNYDFTFALFNTNSSNAGQQAGNTLTNLNVGVTNGVFTVTLDFGSVFTGNATWLAIEMRTNGGTVFTALNPLQELTPTPYAMYAPNAGAAASANTVAGSNIVGTIAAGQLPANVITNGESGLSLSGSFSGDGGGLTNITADFLASTSNAVAQTLVYASNGVYNVVVPPLATSMVVKLWGAGGGPDSGAVGGGGAYVGVSLSVTAGQTYTVVVGSTGGGAGSGDAPGGSDPHGTGGGGQASSLFLFTGSTYIMKAVAGGGGGASDWFQIGGGAGGNPGQDPNQAGGGGYNGIGGGNGSNYSANAITVGETSLNLMGGAGGNAASAGYGAGGGGFGGGSGGDGPNGPSGGGSYGDLIIGGANNVPGNTNDPSYVFPQGYNGNDGLVVVQFHVAGPNLPAVLTAVGFSGNGSYLTGLNASNLSSGTIPLAVENPAVVTNNEAGVTLSGAFSGNGVGFTNLNATNLSGSIPLSSMPAAVVTNNESGFTLGKFVVQADDTGANGEAQQLVIEGQSNDKLQLELGYKTTTNYASIQAYQQRAGPSPLVLQPVGGNVGIGARNPAYLLVVGINASPAYCNGTTWQNGSDRNIKAEFSAVSASAILDKVSALPITEWKYKSEAAGTRHLGPVAQDFHAAFGLNGGDDTHIATVDEGGVALAAIQGLNRKVDEKEARIQEQAGEIQALKQSVDDLKKLVQLLAEKK